MNSKRELARIKDNWSDNIKHSIDGAKDVGWLIMRIDKLTKYLEKIYSTKDSLFDGECTVEAEELERILK